MRVEKIRKGMVIAILCEILGVLLVGLITKQALKSNFNSIAFYGVSIICVSISDCAIYRNLKQIRKHTIN